jgi:competence protein ComEC
LLWPQRQLPPPGDVELVVLVVGQGLSVLVRTAGHALLYDMGPGQPGGFDAGASVVSPALHALGVRRLDVAVVSHGDNDHAGGFAGVVAAFPPAQVFTPDGMPLKRIAASAAPAVAGSGTAGLDWTWDGVDFRFLHPPRWFPYLDNASSCVLRVEAGGRVALLPGDIGKVVERGLASRQRDAIRADVLLVAHHGSNGSSDPAFIEAVHPRWALVSAGYGNRFGHPARAVVKRWEVEGARAGITFDTGAQRIRLGVNGVTVQGEREQRRRLWDAVAASAAPATGDR